MTETTNMIKTTTSTPTRQDKTRQDKTRQDKTRQDKTRQDKTRQDKTRQDKRRQDLWRKFKDHGSVPIRCIDGSHPADFVTAKVLRQKKKKKTITNDKGARAL